MLSAALGRDFVASPRLRVNGSRLGRAAAWVVIAWVVVFWRLGYPGLLDPDSAHYAQITREMLSAREWIVPLIDGMPFIDKPVLFHWLQALSFVALGVTEFAARVPSALAALALAWLTYWTGREFLGDRSTGERAAVMFMTMPATFALGRIGLYDMTFAAALFGSVACLIVAAMRARPRLQWIGYALLSLAIMIKGPVAVLLLATAFALAVVGVPTARASLLGLRWLIGPGLAVAAAAPWFAWMWWRFGEEFVQSYVIQGHVWYVTHPFPFRQPNNFFYVRTLFGAFLPWTLLCAGRIIDRIVSRRRAPFGEAEVVLWMWSAAVLGVFTLARFKLDTYVYPAAPALCLIAARAWESSRTSHESVFWQRSAIAAIGVLLVGAAAVLASSMFDLDLRISPWAIVLPMGLAAGGASFVIVYRRAGWRPPRSAPVTVVCTLLFLYGSVVIFGFPVIDESRPTPEVGAWISSHQPPGQPVGTFNVSQWNSSLRYYSERPVIDLNDETEVRAFFARLPKSVVVMRQRDYRALTANGLRARVFFWRDAVTGMKGRGLRQQLWGRLVVVGADNVGPLAIAAR
jgi:4-amino-4-deoxy-L-arabinose transferase-like glycosyltransferase